MISMDQFTTPHGADSDRHRKLLHQCRDALAQARRACLRAGLRGGHLYIIDADDAGPGMDLFALWSADRGGPPRHPGVLVTGMPTDMSLHWLTAHTPGIPPTVVSRLADRDCFWVVVASGHVSVTRMDPDPEVTSIL
jgi:hypothetical protein